jgi:hypothetical protein
MARKFAVKARSNPSESTIESYVLRATTLFCRKHADLLQS